MVWKCLVVTIPHKVFLKWRDLKKVIGNVSYVEFLQESISHLPFMLKDSNERIENDLQCLVSKVYNQSRGLQGNTRVTKTRSIYVSHDEVVNASSLKARLDKAEEDNKGLQEKLKDARNCFKNFKSAKIR